MAELYEYAVAVHLYKPVIKRAVVDFAVGADWTPAAGDVKISIDGGAAANVTNLPTALTMGNTVLWDFSLTAGELTGKKIRITVADAATKVVEDVAFEMDTYGNASAQHKVNLNDSVRAGLTSLPNASAGASGGVPTIDANLNTSSDLKRINGDATSAANLAKTTRAIARGTVTAGASTTSIPTSAMSPATAVADQLKGRIVTFDADTTTANLRSQSTDITASSASATPTLTVTALTTAPVAGDLFSIT